MKRMQLVISGAFAAVSYWMCVRVTCPVLQVSLPEAYNKTAEINGLTALQILFEDTRLCKIIHGNQKEYGLTNNH